MRQIYKYSAPPVLICIFGVLNIAPLNLLYIDRSNKLSVLAETLAIPEFAVIWKRDTSKNKDTAFREFSYIYFLCDYNSTYLSYSYKERSEKLLKDFKVKISDEITSAIKKYEELQQTPSMRFLKAATNALESMEGYFEDIDFAERDKHGKPIYSPVEVSRCLKDCGGIMDSLEKLSDKVRSEINSQMITRGGAAVNIFEK